MKDQAANAVMEGVYMLPFGPAGELLYIGETNDYDRRMGEHVNSGSKWQRRASKFGEFAAEELTPRVVGFLRLAPIPNLSKRTNKFIRNVAETMILETLNLDGKQTLNSGSSVSKNGSIASARLGRHASRMSSELKRQFTEFFNLLWR